MTSTTDFADLSMEARQALFLSWLERARGREIIWKEEAPSSTQPTSWLTGTPWAINADPKDFRIAIANEAKIENFANCSFREVDSDTWDRFDEWLKSRGIGF